MLNSKVYFYSGDDKISGFRCSGRNLDNSKPLLVILSSHRGLLDGLNMKVSQYFCENGFECFSFYFRGYDEENSRFTKYIAIEEQVEDIANSVAYAHSIAKGRSVLVAGWGMVGGIMLKASKLTNDISAFISINSFYSNSRTQDAIHGAGSFKKLIGKISLDRRNMVLKGIRKHYEPYEFIPSLKADRSYNTKTSDDDKMPLVPLSFANSFVNFDVSSDLSHLENIPLLIVHGIDNKTYPISEAKALYISYPGPKKLFEVSRSDSLFFVNEDDKFRDGILSHIDKFIKDNGLLRVE